MPNGNPMALEGESLLLPLVLTMVMAPEFALMVALGGALREGEVDVEFVATRSQEGHMVKVVAGNCM